MPCLGHAAQNSSISALAIGSILSANDTELLESPDAEQKTPAAAGVLIAYHVLTKGAAEIAARALLQPHCRGPGNAVLPDARPAWPG